MKVCFFGTYTRAEGYPVNRVLIKGLRRAGAVVVECRQDLLGPFLYESLRKWRNPLRLLALICRIPATYLKLVWHYWRAEDHDCVIVGYAGYVDVLLARVLRRRRLLVLVAFISLYDTLVLDRDQVKAQSLKGRSLKLVDRLAFKAADVVLVDTEEQRRHFASLFDLPVEKFHRSFVGEDDDDFRPMDGEAGDSGTFRVLFFGTYVPLHGIDVIVDAAALLAAEADICFTVIGNGQLYPALRRRADERQLSNLEFVDHWVGTADLMRHIENADVSLGIFGTTPKAARVIPCKVFDALAMKKPVVTRDSPAIREMLTHGETALLCEPGSGADLARSLLRLRDDPALRSAIGEAGYTRYRQNGSPEAVGSALLKMLETKVTSD
jgi:glycosyltransferase involved in cell wall biosynthesis